MSFWALLTKHAILYSFYVCVFWHVLVRPFWTKFRSCSIFPIAHNPFETGITMYFQWFWCFCPSKKKYWFSLSVAMCRFKCIYVLLRIGFSFEKMIFRNENLFIFDSRACWHEELIWGPLEASWSKTTILTRTSGFFWKALFRPSWHHLAMSAI